MRRGAHGTLPPHQPLPGVIPVPARPVVAKVQGQPAKIAPEAPRVVGTVADVLDYTLPREVIAAPTPIDLLDRRRPRGSSCWPCPLRHRACMPVSTPPRAALAFSTYKQAVAASGGHLTPPASNRLRKFTQVDKALSAYWQWPVYEVHPELSFVQLSSRRQLKYPKPMRVEAAAYTTGPTDTVHDVLVSRLSSYGGIRYVPCERHASDTGSVFFLLNVYANWVVHAVMAVENVTMIWHNKLGGASSSGGPTSASALSGEQ